MAADVIDNVYPNSPITNLYSSPCFLTVLYLSCQLVIIIVSITYYVTSYILYVSCNCSISLHLVNYYIFTYFIFDVYTLTKTTYILIKQ